MIKEVPWMIGHHSAIVVNTTAIFNGHILCTIQKVFYHFAIVVKFYHTMFQLLSSSDTYCAV